MHNERERNIELDWDRPSALQRTPLPLDSWCRRLPREEVVVVEKGFRRHPALANLANEWKSHDSILSLRRYDFLQYH